MKKLLFLLMSFVLVFASDYDKSKKMIAKTNSLLSKKQKSIDNLDSKKDDIFNEYVNLSIKLENIKNQNKRLEKLVSIQDDKLMKIGQDIDNIERTKSEVYPLMSSMYAGLEKLISQSVPFALKERSERVKKLKDLIDRDDVQRSEKFRKILEAYEIEYDYTNTIGSYQSMENGVAYNFLRIGTLGFYRQSLDKKNFSVWNNKAKKWEDVDSIQDRINITNGIKIAKKQVSPTLIRLPFVVIKDAK